MLVSLPHLVQQPADVIPTTLKTDKAIVKTRIRDQGGDMSGRRIACDHFVGLQAEDANVILAINRYQSVRTEL